MRSSLIWNRSLAVRQLEPAGSPLIGTGLTVQTSGASSLGHGSGQLVSRWGCSVGLHEVTERIMPIIHEQTTVTATGRLTLPRSVRQVLGVEIGDAVAFDVHDDGRIVISRASGEHKDPAIQAFLGVLAQDIRHSKRVRQLPKALIQAMQAHGGSRVDPDEEIEGDVVL